MKKIECWRNPTQIEIHRGYGALHWREFSLPEISINGRLKRWFKADDGLIYHTN
jgi:hypothetical protein